MIFPIPVSSLSFRRLKFLFFHSFKPLQPFMLPADIQSRRVILYPWPLACNAHLTFKRTDAGACPHDQACFAMFWPPVFIGSGFIISLFAFF